MAKRIPPSPTSPVQSRKVDEGKQYEQHALTHEDGDAETLGARAVPDEESVCGPHDENAVTGRRAPGPAPVMRSPVRALRIEWPASTLGVLPEVHAEQEQTDQAEAGVAGQAAGSRGRSGGSAERGRANAGEREQRDERGERSLPQQTAHASVPSRSRSPTPADAALREDIRKRLSEARDLDVSHVEVTVTSGLVLLTGYVPERWMQHVVQTEVEKVAGVSGVDNQLHERRLKAMSRPGESQEGHKI